MHRFIVGQDLDVSYAINAYHHYQTWKDNIEKIKINIIVAESYFTCKTECELFIAHDLTL